MSSQSGADSAGRYRNAALAFAAASAATPVHALLFQRDQIAVDLGLREPLVGESLLVAVVAALASLVWLWLARRWGPGPLMALGSLACGGGWLLAASATDISVFLSGLLIAAVGTAAIVLTHRPALVATNAPGGAHRALSEWWAAVGVGAAATLVVSVAEPVAWSTTLRAAGIASLVAAVLVGFTSRHRFTGLHRPPESSTTGIRSLRSRWVRRSTWTAAAAGLIVFAGADAITEVLLVKWELNPEGFAAVLAAVAGGFVGAALLAHWYIDLETLQRGQRAHVVGTGLLLAGGLAVFGASSFTYVGLVISWVGAGAAVGVVAVALDLATLPDLSSPSRQAACALTFVALLGGALLGVALLAGPLNSLDADVQLGVLATPLFLIGLITVFRSGDSPAVPAPSEMATPMASFGVGASTDRPAPLLVCSDLEVAYGHVQALFGVNLTVGEGEVVALLGANGAGKTTTLRAISGLEPVQQGRLLFSGVDITEIPATWRVGLGISQVVGGEAVVDPLSVSENLRLFGHSLSRADRDAAIDAAFAVFPRLAERADQSAATLSGGEKQMLALAKTVMIEPRLLVIDEFSLGLAPVVVSSLLPVLTSLKQAGTAILLVEQSVNTALALADHVYCIERGEIVFEGAADELASDPETLHTVLVEGVARTLER